ncbi:leucine-rich repeat-containing protein 47-like [Cataglyphis hispanica]|uniref:leucine-rich repeat-containing protein 47-like n=1 Tax=Cataglyphis hispanica TaxID=1086592 RepID=UPI00218038DC|nr:leucine-rich repeat-containing protein 47-like [Cataglyphis hispanica]
MSSVVSPKKMTTESTKSTLVAIKQADEEKKHHLVLTGSAVSETLKRSGLDKNLFNLRQLNYLSITRTCLQSVPEEIGELTNLTTLILHSNEIAELPSSIDKLINLKVFDCSRNKLASYPQQLCNLPQLKILNLASNLLESIPSLRKNVALSVLNIGNNKLKIFPDVCYAELICLSEIYVNNNKIKQIPITIKQLSGLRVLNLECNLFADLPAELTEINQLEQLHLMSDDNTETSCDCVNIATKIYNHLELSNIAHHYTNLKKNNHFPSCFDLMHLKRPKIVIERVTHNTPAIEVTEHVYSVRPFIAACILKNINFTEISFKKFLQLQIRLRNGICENKYAATLVTHDMKFIESGNLTYTAKSSKELKIQPSMRKKMYTGKELFEKLQAEAENVRKITKQDVYPERYKYLNLLKGKSLFPCLLDYSGAVLSLPPIINSKITEVSLSTQQMLVEVTSGSSYTICRNILDQFLKELLISDIIDPKLKETNDYNSITVEQVKVKFMDRKQKVIYPSTKDFDEDFMKDLIKVVVEREKEIR